MKLIKFDRAISRSLSPAAPSAVSGKGFLKVCGLSLVLAMKASAQLQVSDPAETITITFDSTISGVINGQFTGGGFQPTPSTGQLDSDAWAITGWSNGTLAFGGTQTTAGTDYTRGTTTAAVTTGGIYAFGTTNRMLMIQPGGSDFAPGTMTLKIQNTTGAAVSTWDLAYDLYVRNDQLRSNSFNFSYSTNNTSYLTTGLVAADPLFAYTSTAAAGTDTGLNLIGTPMASIAATVENNEFLYIRWSSADVGGSGSRDEFAIDNLYVTAVPEPGTAVLGVVALLGFLRRRRA
jgi:hypothetical protein